MGTVRQAIHTDQAPKAIGPYSQAVRVGDTVYLAGQIPLDPVTMQMVEGDFEKEARRVFENIKAVIAASGGTFAQVVKVTIFLTDFANFAKVNEMMAQYFQEPYPARSTVAVAGLPRNARVEVECTLHLG
jgi:reactive intermediate/imine deaminase